MLVQAVSHTLPCEPLSCLAIQLPSLALPCPVLPFPLLPSSLYVRGGQTLPGLTWQARKAVNNHWQSHLAQVTGVCPSDLVQH